MKNLSKSVNLDYLNYIIPENTYKRIKIMILNKVKNILNSSLNEISKSTNSKFYLKENYNTSNYEINEIIRENDLLSIKESDLSAKAIKIQTTKVVKEKILELISKFIIQVEEKNN